MVSKIEVGCHECKKENSDPDNPIVFCNQCKTPYHQRCHRPHIDRICIDVLDAKWFCNRCIGQHPELSLETGVPGTEFEPETRKAYLSSLSKTQLINLLEYAETMEPSLPIYSPNTRKHVARLKQETDDIKHIEYQMRPGNEDLVVNVVTERSRKYPDSQGVSVREIFKQIEEDEKQNDLDPAFKHSATRALQRALRKGRLTERNGRYLPNPFYQPSSELGLTQLLKGDDNVMFSHFPLRLVDGQDQNEVLKSDVFSHRVYIN